MCELRCSVVTSDDGKALSEDTDLSPLQMCHWGHFHEWGGIIKHDQERMQRKRCSWEKRIKRRMKRRCSHMKSRTVWIVGGERKNRWTQSLSTSPHGCRRGRGRVPERMRPSCHNVAKTASRRTTVLSASLRIGVWCLSFQKECFVNKTRCFYQRKTNRLHLPLRVITSRLKKQTNMGLICTGTL